VLSNCGYPVNFECYTIKQLTGCATMGSCVTVLARHDTMTKKELLVWKFMLVHWHWHRHKNKLITKGSR